MGFRVQEGVTTIPSAPLGDAGMWGERTASFIPLGIAEQEEAGLLARGFSNRRLELKTEAGAGAAETDTCLRAGHGLAGWSCDGQHVLELRRRHVLIPRGQGPHKRVGVSAVR